MLGETEKETEKERKHMRIVRNTAFVRNLEVEVTNMVNDWGESGSWRAFSNVIGFYLK